VLRPEQLLPGQTIDVLSGGWTIGGESTAIALADGIVTGAVVDAATTGTIVDATGWMLLPPLADLHAHIDKAYTWEAAGRPEGSLEDAVACWATFGERLTEREIRRNARRQLVAAAQAGVTAIRSHVNYHPGDDPLRGVRAVVDLREEFRGIVDLQVVAMHGQFTEDALVRDAIALGADLVGGAPHLADDPRAELERALALAEEAGIGVDLHMDETLDPAHLGLADLAALTRDWPDHMTRSAGHCVSLAMQEPDTLASVLDAVAEARIGIVTNPLTNLYLQGWEHPVATPRAIPPLRRIMAHGVTLAAGGDNVQDPFNPLGNGDIVDVVAALVLAGHLTPTEAWGVAADGGRAMLGLPAAGGRPGDAADMVLVRATSVSEAVAERAPDRVVIRGGRVIATRVTTSSILDPADVDADAPGLEALLTETA